MCLMSEKEDRSYTLRLSQSKHDYVAWDLKAWVHVVFWMSNVEQETRVTAASDGGKYLR